MTRYFLVIVLLLAISSLGSAQPSPQQSHIEANVPAQSQFASFLKRDLLAYFKQHGLSTATRVQVQLLREVPTQSGVSYPKYYAWVEVFAGDKSLQLGAVRLAAIERIRFDITNFVSKDQARADRSAVEKVFPPILVPDIVRRAKAAQ